MSTAAKILAKALIETAYETDVQCGMNAYNECKHCGDSVYWDRPVEEIEHTAVCPVLLAKTVLEQ